MKKKTVYSRCPATISGKHEWIDHIHYGDEFTSPLALEHPQCQYCEIIDDTVILKHEKQGDQVKKVVYP